MERVRSSLFLSGTFLGFRRPLLVSHRLVPLVHRLTQSSNQERFSFLRPPPSQSKPPIRSQTQQSSDVHQTNNTSCPPHLQPGDTIPLRPEAPKKPVIYLYPPSSLADVTVELSLTSSWRFSAVHPPPRTTVPPGMPHTAQLLTWTVSAEPDGTLVDKTSGMEVSYLYWEAT